MIIVMIIITMIILSFEYSTTSQQAIKTTYHWTAAPKRF